MERIAGGCHGLIVPAHGGGDFQKSLIRPRIWVGPARALYVGPGLDLAPHLNVATTLAVALAEPFRLRTWRGGRGWSPWREDGVSLIASETLHHLQCRGPMAFLYLDPLTDRGASPSALALQDGAERLRSTPALGLASAFAAFGLAPRRPTDARIAHVVRAIEEQPQAFSRLHEAAALACMSPSRFRARFGAELGLPFRRYRLWRRLAVVMRTVAVGGPLTEAALAAGFASSAHLSSTFKRTFGMSPRDLLALGVTIDCSEDRTLPPTEVA